MICLLFTNTRMSVSCQTPRSWSAESARDLVRVAQRDGCGGDGWPPICCFVFWSRPSNGFAREVPAGAGCIGNAMVGGDPARLEDGEFGGGGRRLAGTVAAGITAPPGVMAAPLSGAGR